jgi:hypothetical protein
VLKHSIMVARLVLNRKLHRCYKILLLLVIYHVYFLKAATLIPHNKSSLQLVDSTFVDGLKPVLQKLSNSELFSTIIPGRIHATRTCHGKILELRVCALGNTDSGRSGSISMDRSYDGMRRPVVETSKMTVSEKCKKYLVDYRDSKNNQSERCSEVEKGVEKEVEKAKHRVLVRSGSLIQEVILFLNDSHLSSLLHIISYPYSQLFAAFVKSQLIH